MAYPYHLDYCYQPSLLQKSRGWSDGGVELSIKDYARISYGFLYGGAYNPSPLDRSAGATHHSTEDSSLLVSMPSPEVLVFTEESPIFVAVPPSALSPFASEIPSVEHSCPRRHVCQVCGRCLSRRSSLVSHLSTHNRYKVPSVCPWIGCGRTYSRNQDLRRHVAAVSTATPESPPRSRTKSRAPC